MKPNDCNSQPTHVKKLPTFCLGTTEATPDFFGHCHIDRLINDINRLSDGITRLIDDLLTFAMPVFSKIVKRKQMSET